jgi:DNA invertase Pin-like site-specific DNA recombinase
LPEPHQPAWKRFLAPFLLAQARDVLVVTKLDRLGRTAKDILEET